MLLLAPFVFIALSLLVHPSKLGASALDAELEFNYLPIGHVRTDPIISKDCLSDHVHTFYGPPLMRPEVETSDLVATDAKDHSGLVEENKSLYWHPSIYSFSSETQLFTLDPIYYTSVYYFWDTSERTYSFPEGFRMIASDTEAFVECVSEDFIPCTRSDGCDAPPGSFFPTEACEMLEITMDFPSCWNGQIDSFDHKSHVVYSLDDDSCPPTHSRRIPTVSISIHIKDYTGGYHTWSDESNAFHADYFSGWDVDLMERFLSGCALDVESCADYVTYKNGPTGCDSHDEKHDKIMAILPDMPDTFSTIASEAVDNVASLPRGQCQGTLLPSASGTNPTSAPTKRPTSSPTNRPTTGTIESCVDDPTLQFRSNPDKNCDWVGRKPGRRCSKTWQGQTLSEYCPEACDECSESCMDDANFFLDGNPNQNCQWVAQDPMDHCDGELPDGRLINEVCPVACDECDRRRRNLRTRKVN